MREWVYAPILLDQERRDALRKLADYLYLLPRNYQSFDMAVYYDIQPLISRHEAIDTGRHDYDAIVFTSEAEEVYQKCKVEPALSCGTVACAIGHVFVAGVEVPKDARRAWVYILRWITQGDSLLEDFLFDPTWADIDNTPQCAAKRIYLALHKGVPSAVGSGYRYTNSQAWFKAIHEDRLYDDIIPEMLVAQEG